MLFDLYYPLLETITLYYTVGRKIMYKFDKIWTVKN